MTTPYYLRLDGEDEDSQWVADADGRNGTAYTVTSNGTPYIVSFDSRLSVDLYEGDGSLHLSIAAPENTGTSGIDYDPVILGIREDSSVRRQAAVSQKGKEYYLSLNGNSSGFSVNAIADGEVMELTCGTNGTPQIQMFEGDAIDSVDIQGDVINIATLPNSSADSRNAVVVVCLEEDPAISITVTVVQAGAETDRRMIIIDITNAPWLQSEAMADLEFEMVDYGLICSMHFDLDGSEDTIDVPFEDVSAEMGYDIEGLAGDNLKVTDSFGYSTSGAIPSSGNMHLALG